MDKTEYVYSIPKGSPPITVDVYCPTSGDLTLHRPVALLLHPGGFVVGDKTIISKGVIECLVVELGIVAVVPDYRLCPSVSVWDGPVTDAKACLKWVYDILPGLLLGDGKLVVIDVDRIATIGFSAGGTLALLLTAEKYKPIACLTFYGELYWSDPVWSQPLPALASLPPLSKDVYDRVYDEGIVVSAPAPSPSDPEGPGLDKPRNAWLMASIKGGWWLREIVKDGDYARIDPATLFGPEFPPTAFIHGTVDVVCPPVMSERAHAALREYGVDTALFRALDQPHDFDASLTRHDECFGIVREALQWLGRKVGSL